jgi:ferrous iron transport protein B
MEHKGISLDIPFRRTAQNKNRLISLRKGFGIEELKKPIATYKTISAEPCLKSNL